MEIQDLGEFLNYFNKVHERTMKVVRCIPPEKVDWRLLGMIEALKNQEEDPAARELSFSERFGLLIDQQWNWRENQALGRRLKNARLRMNACIEEIDYRSARGLDKSVIRALTQESAWVGTHENIFVLGPTDPATL